MTATDDAGAPNEAQGSASSTLHGVTISPEAAPVVTLAAIPDSGLIEGGFTAGQALNSYTVSADQDGSTISLSVSDDAPAGQGGPHAAYFSLNNGQVQLTSAGADYFNSHDGTSLTALHVTVTAADDAGQSTEMSGSATTSLAAGGVGIGAEAPLTVTLQSIAQEGLQEGAFSAGQALFSYSVSADSDGSAISLSVTGDNQSTYHVASQDTPITVHDMFSIDTQNHALVLTSLGAEYFNSAEASTLQAMTVDLVATDDAGSPSPFESQSVARADLSQVSIANEAPPTVTVQAIAQSGLVEGGFTTGQALFSYTVSADTDGSTQSLSVADNVSGTHPPYFALSAGQVVLTSVGAAYFNSHDADVLQSVQVTVTARDDATEGGHESQSTASTTLDAGHVSIAPEPAPTVTVQAISQSYLVEGGFSAGQGLFSYTVSADTDHSTQTLSVSDNVTGTHPAYFALSEGQVVLTTDGAAYFNSHEAADLQSIQVSVTATDDASGGGNESQATATTTLAAGHVPIADEPAPTVTVQAISQSYLVEGGFSAGQGLFSYTVSADTDGSTQTLSVSDSVSGVHPAYFALSEGQVVLTTAGADYFNTHEAADLQSIQVSVTATDDPSDGGNESQGTATTSLAAAQVPIAPEAAPTITANYVTPTQGYYQAGQILYTIGLSADADGSTISTSVSDNVAGLHGAYFAVSGGNVVLTELGAYFMSTNGGGNGLSSVDVTITATDDGSESSSTVSVPVLGTNEGPVALDLTGSGIQYVGLNAGIQYSYSATAPAVDTAWVAPQDGVLAYKGTDGSIQVVFSTAPGQTDLQGLAQVYDANHDGVLSSSDPSFGNFGVLQIAGAGATPTFTSLSALGVADISLVSNGQASTAANGNVTIYGQTTYQLSDGVTLAAADVSFATTPIGSTGSSQAGAVTSATALSSASANPATSVTQANEAVTNLATTAHTDASTLAGTSASAAIETASLAVAGTAVTPAPAASADAHAVAAAAQNSSDPSTTDSHALTAASSAMTIDLTGATYTVTPNLPATAGSVALDTFSLAADPAAHTATGSGSGSSWVDILSTSAAQSVSMLASQPDAHASTTAPDGTAHPEGWVAAVDTATTDPHAAAAPAATGDANPLVNLPAIAPADLLLHDSTTVATNPWHA